MKKQNASKAGKHEDKGDKIAIVSLFWGGLGDESLIHRYLIAKERMEKDFWMETSSSMAPGAT